MKLLPRLIKSTLLLSFGERVVSGKDRWQVENGRKQIDVEVWDGVGLCIHAYNDEARDTWRISHVESGRSILRHMKNREQAINYLLKVKALDVNWKCTEEEFTRSPRREGIKKALDGLQKEISGERR